MQSKYTLNHRRTLWTTAHPPTTIATPITIAVNIAGVESKCKNVYKIIPIMNWKWKIISIKFVTIYELFEPYPTSNYPCLVFEDYIFVLITMKFSVAFGSNNKQNHAWWIDGC